MDTDHPEQTTSPDGQAVPGWSVERYPSVVTTQGLARSRPAWSAVIAEMQTAGRGQYDRSFASDRGGFYLTAVLPFDGDAAGWRGFALAIGWALQSRLTAEGVLGLRLRWPNDLMIGSRKIGGILTEQGGTDTLLVGLGINVTNRPWDADPTLTHSAGRLLDQVGCPFQGPDQLVEPVLLAIRHAHAVFSEQRLVAFASAINRCWRGTRRVELDLMDGVTAAARTGDFAGINPRGDVLLRTDAGHLVAVPEHHIRRLREV